MANPRIVRALALASCLAAGLLGLAAVEPVPPAPEAPGAGSAPPADPPAGDLLIASAQIQDPRFYHTVILLLRHNADGAFGIVVNHPLARETVAHLLAATGEEDKSVEGDVPVFSGGPVQPELGFLVHSAEYRRAGTLAVDGKVAMTASRDALKDIGHHQGPKQFFFAFGYAGWGPGQLEGEIAHNDWFVTADDPALVFAEDSGSVWDRALARRGQDL
ncbi:MAG TPA: YqgE/AlgH family protein [Stellaceae bacterium]|nr:YqgE/AlgH family protein [Stellaceae bacterium]